MNNTPVALDTDCDEFHLNPGGEKNYMSKMQWHNFKKDCYLS